MAKRKTVTHALIAITPKGLAIQWPKTDDVSPVYSRKQVKCLIADLQSALAGDMFAAQKTTSRVRAG